MTVAEGNGRLRVAYVYRHFSTRGSIPSVFRRHAERLSRDEDVIAVCSGVSREPTDAPLRFLSVEPLARGTGRLRYAVECATFASRAARALDRLRGQVDVVHVEGFASLWADLVSVHAVRRAELDHYFSEVEPRAWLRRRLASVIRPQTGVVVRIEDQLLGTPPHPVCMVPTRKIRDELTAHYDIDPSLVQLVRYGIDTSRMAFDPAARQRLRARHGAAPGQVVALFIGDGFERKGLARAIEGIARARTNPVLWVAGGGNAGPYREQARRAGVEDRVVFLGSVPNPQLGAHLSAADAMLLPSQQDSWGHTVIEAMAVGRVPVVSEFTGASEILETGRTGVVLPGNGHPEAIAAALDGPLRDDEARERMGALGLELARDYDVEAVYPRFREVHHIAHETRLARLGEAGQRAVASTP